MKNLNVAALFALIFGAASTFQVDKAEVDAGGVASTPSIQVGSDNGKPLFARIQFSTDRAFPETPALTPAAIASVASEGATIAQNAGVDVHA